MLEIERIFIIKKGMYISYKEFIFVFFLYDFCVYKEIIGRLKVKDID